VKIIFALDDIWMVLYTIVFLIENRWGRISISFLNAGCYIEIIN
jgi:hypothetical protein